MADTDFIQREKIRRQVRASIIRQEIRKEERVRRQQELRHMQQEQWTNYVLSLYVNKSLRESTLKFHQNQPVQMPYDESLYDHMLPSSSVPGRSYSDPIRGRGQGKGQPPGVFMGRIPVPQ